MEKRISGLFSLLRTRKVCEHLELKPFDYSQIPTATETFLLKVRSLFPSKAIRQAVQGADVLPPGVVKFLCGGVVCDEPLLPRLAQRQGSGRPQDGRVLSTAAALVRAKLHRQLCVPGNISQHSSKTSCESTGEQEVTEMSINLWLSGRLEMVIFSFLK